MAVLFICCVKKFQFTLLVIIILKVGYFQSNEELFSLITISFITPTVDPAERSGLILADSLSESWKCNRFLVCCKAASKPRCVIMMVPSGFPPIREIREFRENFEDFFQSGKSGKNRGFSAKIREKNFKSGNFFPKPFSNLLNL